jgi:hypothetical protein
MNSNGWHAQEWAAFGQVGALAVAAIAGVLVWLQVRQGRQLREDQSRPYVIVDFEFRSMLVMLSISNIGSTPATDVRIEFDRPLDSPTAGLNPNRFAVFAEPIPMLAPGRKINFTFGKGPDFFPKDGSAVPLRYVVHAKYRPLQQNRRFLKKQKVYADPPLVLDLQPFKYAAIDHDDLHQIHQNLKNMNHLIKSWTNGQRLQVNTITQAEIDQRNRSWFEDREHDSSTTAEHHPESDS